MLFCSLLIPAAGREEQDQGGGQVSIDSIKALLDSGKVEEAVKSLQVFLLSGKGTEKENWVVSRLVYNACTRGEREGDFMGAAVRWTDDLGQRAEPWILLGIAYLFQAEDLAQAGDPSGAGYMVEPVGFTRSFSNSFLYQAEESFREALERDPSNSEAGNLLAWSLCRLKDYAGARERALAVLAAQPDNSYTCYLMGEIELYFERAPEALTMFRKAFELDPRCTSALAGEVRSLNILEKPAEAEKALLVLVNVEPLREEIVLLAFAVHEKREDYAAAARLYRELLQSAPDRADLLLQLAVVEIRLMSLRAARVSLGKILLSEPEHCGALFLLGQVEEKEGRYDEAIPLYMKVADNESAWLDTALKRLKALAYMKSINGSYDDAIVIYDKLRKVFPFDSALLSNWALALSQKGLVARADEAFAGILEITPDDYAIQNNYGLHLMASGRMKRGLAMLERAALEGGDMDAAENLGVHYLYSKKEPSRAAEFFSLVLRNDPNREKSLILLESIRRHRGSGSD